MTLLTGGFRPFFLASGVWAVLSMVLWIMHLSWSVDIPSAFYPVDWHAHTFLYGYVSAVVAGFLLTAVPNWTKSPALRGTPLGLLFLLWIAGRIAILFSGQLPLLLVALVDISFNIVLGLYILSHIIRAKNWRNLVVIALLLLHVASNAVFFWDVANDARAASGLGSRMGIVAVLLLVALIGGRIIPSFTGNWLAKHNPEAPKPAPVMGAFDKLAILFLVVASTGWLFIPTSKITALMLMLTGGLHLFRQRRWSPLQTLNNPLLWILHVAYAFVSLGAVLLGLAIAAPDVFDPLSAQHLWMTGAIGVMTLAVMTRAARGHSGLGLEVGAETVLTYVLVILAVIFRLIAGFVSDATLLLQLSALSWIAGFALFTVIYGAICLRPRRKPASA